MQQVTITSKLQLTIPSKIAKRIGLRRGDKIEVSEVHGKIILTPLRQLVEELAGSISVPEKWKGRDIDDIIGEAKDEYFRSRYRSKKA